MRTELSKVLARRHPGEWVAISMGRIIAHGLDLHEVALDACAEAIDIIFDRVPDPQASLWQPPLVPIPPAPILLR